MSTHSCCMICQGIKGESGPSGPPGLQGVQVSCLSPKFSGELWFSIPTLARVFLCRSVYSILQPGLTLREMSGCMTLLDYSSVLCMRLGADNCEKLLVSVRTKSNKQYKSLQANYA